MISVHPLECGWMTTDWSNLCVGKAGSTRIPVLAWLVKHPQGTVLFDAGLHRELQVDTSRLGYIADLFQLEFPTGLSLGQLIEQQGVAPAQVNYLVLSHLHFDHCGGAAEVPNARLLVQKAEWQAGQGSKLVDSGVFNPDDYAVGHDVQLIDGYHDIFADKKVICIPTPGHTPGHQSLRVELDAGPIVLTSDCSYCEFMLEQDLRPPVVFNHDDFTRSHQRIKALRDEGCTLYYGHDAQQWLAMKP